MRISAGQSHLTDKNITQSMKAKSNVWLEEQVKESQVFNNKSLEITNYL